MPPGDERHKASALRAQSIPQHAKEAVQTSYSGPTSSKAKAKNFCGCGDFAARPAHGPYLRLLGWQPESDTWAGSVLFVCKPGVAERPVLSWQDSEGHKGQVEPEFLDHFYDWNFWRYALEVPMSEQEKKVNYWLDFDQDKKYTFHVAGREQPWHWAYFSCNGMTEDVPEADVRDKYNGLDPLWQDMLQRHAAAPLHAMVGGGDQLYCDDVMLVPALKDWFETTPDKRLEAEWTDEMTKDVEEYYFQHYAVHFSNGAFGVAAASIPYVMSYDDHDVYDGYGSYPTALQNCPVFQGVWRAAKRFYLLFQLHTTHELANKHGCFGTNSYNQLVLLGPRVAIAMPDCRSERSKYQVLSLETHMQLIVKVQELPDTVRHLVVGTTVPVVYPTIFGGERILTACDKLCNYKVFRTMFKASGLYSAIFTKYGEPSLLDDLRDHWNAPTHKEEQRFLVEHLQMLAKSKQLRISLISGDVHVAASGRLYSRPKKDLRYDFRYMPQIVSSAIGNAAPPDALIKFLHLVGRAGHINRHTNHKMVKTFQRKQRLLNERNWCEVWELVPPGSATAPATAPAGAAVGAAGTAGAGGHGPGAASGGAAAANGNGTAGATSSSATGGSSAQSGKCVASPFEMSANDVQAGQAWAQGDKRSSGDINAPSNTAKGDKHSTGASRDAKAAAAARAALAASGQVQRHAGPQPAHGWPQVQPWHANAADPGSLVFALRVEHIKKEAEGGRVIREYQTLVPQLQRPPGEREGKDPYQYGHHNWMKHTAQDEGQYGRRIKERHSTTATGAVKHTP